jgi:hypothetical protein
MKIIIFNENKNYLNSKEKEREIHENILNNILKYYILKT